MKRLVCEMCGSADLLKTEGVFVCQSCGTKYSVEEAKKMMVEGTVDVSGSIVKVDSSDRLSNLLLLANRAREENNSEEAKKYYELSLIEDPNSWEASFYSLYYKVQETTVGNLQDNLNKFNTRAITSLDMLISSNTDNLPLSQIDELLINTSALYANVANYISLSWKKMIDDLIHESTQDLIRSLSFGKSQSAYSQYLDSQREKEKTAKRRQQMMGWFALGNSMRKTLISLYDLYISAEQHHDEALLDIMKVCDNLFASDARRIVEMPNSLDFAQSIVEFQGKVQENYPSFESEALRIVDNQAASILTGEGDVTTKNLATKVREVVKNGPRYIEAKRQEKRNEQYWLEHAAEKEELMSRKNELLPQMEALQKQKNNHLRAIDECKKKLNDSVDGENELKSVNDKIRDLWNRHTSLGILKGKEKKSIQAEIENEKAKIPAIEERIEKQKQQLGLVINGKIAELEAEFAPTNDKLRLIGEELRKIEDELRKAR